MRNPRTKDFPWKFFHPYNTWYLSPYLFPFFSSRKHVLFFFASRRTRLFHTFPLIHRGGQGRSGRNNEEASLGGDFSEILVAKSKRELGTVLSTKAIYFTEIKLWISYSRDSPRLERRFKVSLVVIVARNEYGKDLTFLRWGCTSFPEPTFLLEIHRRPSLSSFISSLPLPPLRKRKKKKKYSKGFFYEDSIDRELTEEN